MQAVILVGGLGTRLRPLTCRRPKPLLPIVNRPFIERLLTRLRDEGVSEAILAVQYLADQFRAALGNGERLGIQLRIVEEPEPRGTAGAVKQVAHLLEGATFVLNGDVMTDLDLGAMLATHRQRGSKLTIALEAVENPGAYGLVELAADGRIGRFLEKPRPEEITSNLVNAGTYILEPEVLEHVPADTFSMFERALFPELLRLGEPVYGHPARCYWTDIGKPETYLDVHHDLLAGKLRLPLPGKEIAPGVWLEGDGEIHPTALLNGPLVLGHGVTIAAGAQLGPGSTIGAGCQIGEGAQIAGAVLWEDCRVGAGAMLGRCVLGQGVTIGAGTRVSEGALLGDGCMVGAENTLARGVRLWPGVTLGDGAISF